MKKNPTPREIALYSALIASSILLLLIIFFNLLFGLQIPFWIVLAISVIVLITVYSVSYIFLERFIYRKIKVIYKNIHDLKVTKGSIAKKMDMSSDMLSDVNEEVLDWAEEKSQEIEDLKLRAIYRREFLGNIAHELKTPLFNIQGYIHTLIDGELKDHNINMDFLRKAANNAERLSTIIEDLDTISAFESGQLRLNLERFDVNQLTTEIFDALMIRAKEKNISLRIKQGCDRPFEVVADKERIRQVLTNLIQNSMKYGKAGGTTKVGFYDMDKQILVDVTDDGIGIEEKHLPRLFERFYRVDKSRSRAEGGTGIGLAIVKHIIEAHQETINVRSTINLGSTFGFTLKKAI